MNYTEIILAVIGLLATVITSLIVPLLNAKLKNEKLANAIAKIDKYVEAAQQIFGTGSNEAKKEMVITLLESEGITVDASLNAIIEASVYSLIKIADQIELPTAEEPTVPELDK